MINIDNLFIAPADVCKGIADNIKKQRKYRRITQKELANKSGVSYASVRRFESTGQISLESLVRIAFVMDLQPELQKLFSERHYNSIEEIINEQNLNG